MLGDASWLILRLAYPAFFEHTRGNNTMAITAEQVKTLRELTGAGMMECKKALMATSGDLEKAKDELRKLGQVKADKKADRSAAEGVIFQHEGAMLELNCETDFVARDLNFLELGRAIAKTISSHKIHDLETLLKTPLSGSSDSVESHRQNLIAKIGENIQIRRIVFVDVTAVVGSYMHGSRIGVLVALENGDEELARDIAMHIAASNPKVVSPDQVPSEVVAKEKELLLAQSANSGKPQDIIEKMVAGRMKKFLDEMSLQGQSFVKDPDLTVGALLNKHRAKVISFYRFEVGEGIEKIKEDFREAVMAQISQS